LVRAIGTVDGVQELLMDGNIPTTGTRQDLSLYGQLVPASGAAQPWSPNEKPRHESRGPVIPQRISGYEDPSALGRSYASCLNATPERMKANRSALTRSACVVGMPCGRSL